MEENPYSAPESKIIDENLVNPDDFELANRSTRLVASILDSIIMVAIYFPIAMLLGFLDFQNPKTDIASVAILAVMGLGVYLLLNGRLLVTQGQTIGKKLMKIRVIDETTKEVPSAVDIIGKRYAIFYIIGQIPFASIVNLIDALMIFRSSKKCLHDDIANTIVIKA